MFYIDRPPFPKKDVLLFRILPAVVVFLSLFTVTIYGYANAKQNLRNEQSKMVAQLNNQNIVSMRQRIQAYEDILRGGSGLFYASDDVTQKEWLDFLGTYDTGKRYPSIKGLGYITLDSITDKTPSTTVHYLAPATAQNKRLVGKDLYKDPSGKSAMDRARDEADVSLSYTPSSSGKSDLPDMQLFYPLYRRGTVPSTVEQRRKQLEGFVFITFKSSDFFRNTITPSSSEYGIRAHDKATDSNEFLYQSKSYDKVEQDPEVVRNDSRLEVAGTEWQILGSVTTRIINTPQRARPAVTFWTGALFSLLLAGFIYMLLANRARVLAEREDTSIQAAKDELLALASHQLRTPATGVKQYVGMLKEGLAGKLTPAQKNLVRKAYESNERQLATINEMLFVARVDAGQLIMEKTKVDMRKLVTQVFNEQKQLMDSKEQRYKLKLPKKPVYFIGDEQFLRMAFENILNNASKYTKQGGQITTELSSNLRAKNITLRVSDTGVGVAEEDRHLLFQKFSRIPNELTGKVSGTGIGLYMAKKVIKGHKGKLQFLSEAGSGSTVIMTLPMTSTADVKPSKKR